MSISAAPRVSQVLREDSFCHYEMQSLCKMITTATTKILMACSCPPSPGLYLGTSKEVYGMSFLSPTALLRLVSRPAGPTGFGTCYIVFRCVLLEANAHCGRVPAHSSVSFRTVGLEWCSSAPISTGMWKTQVKETLNTDAHRGP